MYYYFLQIIILYYIILYYIILYYIILHYITLLFCMITLLCILVLIMCRRLAAQMDPAAPGVIQGPYRGCPAAHRWQGRLGCPDRGAKNIVLLY